MTNRKILYGYQIQHGELAIVPQEAEVVQRVSALYLDGLSYQRISDILNSDGFPFSAETPLWNKHKGEAPAGEPPLHRGGRLSAHS